jgi:trehalose 6-phosphate phosphatase
LKYLFSRASDDLLERFARSNVLLALDYDGTLAPLVSEPERAAMRLSTHRLLKRASKLYPCVIISGRAQADALTRLRGVDVRRVVGNHGAEPSLRPEGMRRRVAQWLPVIKRRLSGTRGVVIEDKGLSVAVHYRRARQRNAARRVILDAGRSLNDVRIIGGKLVVNFVVRGAPHKGLALEHQRSDFDCDTTIYVGDDETDEDIFELHRRGCLLSIRVGQKRTSAASYYLRNQAEIDRLLRMLVNLRGNHSDRRRRIGFNRPTTGGI